jgi:hypothetical protein
LAGSSRIISSGIAEQRGGDAQSLFHSQRVRPVAVVAATAETDLFEQRRNRCGVVTPDGREHAQVLGAGQRRIEGRALDHCADPPEVAGRFLDRRAEHRRRARRRADEAEQHRHRRRLAGAVRADEAGDDPAR